ncbi:MAG: DUF2931 family protein [Limnohabitans sp.]|nr:DUF2931 family protein [Limnohabitans sp.]
MKKIIRTIGLLLLTISSACQNKKQEKMQTIEEFDWVEAMNAPKGYPIEVYAGGFVLKNGMTVGMSAGVTTVEWGGNYSGMRSGIKPLPERLNMSWVAFDEGCLYTIDCPIDYDKILALFKEGYQNSSFFFNRNGAYKKMTYNVIQAGFLPGGGVVVWVRGAGRQVEIGRYQGHKTEMPKQENIAKLDNHDKLYFSKDYYASILNNTKIVPLEIQEYKKKHPIPFGLWDSYRTKYLWKPTFTSEQEGFEVKDVGIKNFNGENEELFDQSLVKNEPQKRAIIHSISIGWKDKENQAYGGNIEFNEKVIFTAFEELFKENPNAQAEIEFRVNIANTFITAFLKCNGKTIPLNKEAKVEVFKSRRKF